MYIHIEEPRIRVGELKHCFYCGNSLPATTKEHLFNSCWGGSHCTKKLICNQCNEYFSGNVDFALSQYSNTIMNAGSFKGERHKKIPAIPIDEYQELQAGGKLKLKKPKAELVTQPDGSQQCQISFSSKSQIRRWVREEKELETTLGLSLENDSKERILEAIIKAAQPQMVQKPPEIPKIEVSLDLRKQYRSAAHTILKCLAYYCPDLVQCPATQAIRDFVRYDKGNWLNFAIQAKEVITSIETFNVLKSTTNYNTVTIYWSSYLKKIVGVFTLLGRIDRSVIIAENYSGVDKILFVSENIECTRKPPKTAFVKLNSKTPSMPFVEVRHFQPLIKVWDYFYNEFSVLASQYYPCDAIGADLIKELADFHKEQIKIDEKNLKKHQQFLVNCIVRINKIFQLDANPQEINKRLMKYGFLNLAETCVGKNWEDEEVCSLVNSAFKRTLQDFALAAAYERKYSGS